METPTTHKSILLSAHEIALVHQCLQSGIKDVMEQKVKLADMTTNYDTSAGVFEYYAKRHKALEDINKKLFAKDV